MTKRDLNEFFDFVRPELVALIVSNACDHIGSISEQLCGYAIFPGDVYELTALSAAYTTQKRVVQEKEMDDEEFAIQYTPTEWRGYAFDPFRQSSEKLRATKEAFYSQYCPDEDRLELDEMQLHYSRLIYDAVDESIETLRHCCLDPDVFACIWVADSFQTEVILRSIRRHNALKVFQRFERLL